MSRTTRRALAVALGAVAGGVVRLVAQATHGDVLVPAGDATTAVAVWQVLAAALTAGLVGWGALAAAERWAPTLAPRWPLAATIGAAASLAGPLGMPGIATADRLWLALTHLAVAAVVIPLVSATTVHRTTAVEPAARPTGARA